MYNLYIFCENITNGYKIETLDLFTLISIFCAILTIISRNPIISVLYLIGLFLSISCYLIVSGLNFIALSYLLVYVGAVSILFLFILMLINVRISEIISNTSNSIPLAVLIGIYFNYIVSELLPSSANTISLYFFKQILIKDSDYSYIINTDLFNIFSRYYNDISKLIFVTSKTWDGALGENTHITSIGNIMYCNYLMWLIITSIILLLAMVGAIIITIKHK